jgi:L-aminopeptidase/D-esterase-like protein
MSTGERPLQDPVFDLAELGALAANTLARAVARGVYEAGGVSGAAEVPSYRDVFPQAFSPNPPAPHS